MDERAPIGTDDFLEIQLLAHRYSDAVVRRDAEQWAGCWAPDASWDLGRGSSIDGRDAIVDYWHTAMAGMAAVVQLVHNGEVHAGADPDHASGRWYIDERFRRSDGTNSILLARYDDDYVRVDGRWRYARRALRVSYLGAPGLTDDFLDPEVPRE